MKFKLTKIICLLMIAALCLVSCAKQTPVDVNEDAAQGSDIDNVINSINKKDYKEVVVNSALYAYFSPEELETEADIIFVGEYTGKSENQIIDEEYVVTEYEFKALSFVKGEKADTVIIKQLGGTIGDTFYMTDSDINFEAGKKYFMYARKKSPINQTDREYYQIISWHCYEIDDENNINLEAEKAEDIPKIQAVFEAAVNGAE